MKLIIDRFEGEWAVVELENMDMINIPIQIVPSFAKEGDTLKIIVDENETFSRKKRLEEKFKTLFED